MMLARLTNSQQAGASMRTVDTSYGLLPVIDTWRDCHHTRTGWTGVNDKGERVNVYSQSKDAPACIPPDHLVLSRAAVGDEPSYAGRVPVGAVLIERAPRAKAKRKPPPENEG
jgi:hypothetical protein